MRADCGCALASFDGLRRLTRFVVCHPGWTGPRPVFTSLEYIDGAWGSAIGRLVRYAPVAPVCVVPHELGHVLAGSSEGHGPTWQVTATLVQRMLIDILDPPTS